HFRHFREPSSMSEGSVMPSYAFMLQDNLDTTDLPAKIRAMTTLGVPYPKGYDKVAMADLNTQAKQIANDLLSDSIRISPRKEVIALIAYIQRLGTDITKSTTPTFNR
ncbi:MAG: cbb3-type cytochrome c oxidase subunit II, partial [Bacteroidota bacterium]|nr:cbb3-type cytochrome c oxidase subunit II [Bacteroidota bacterium]